jgi:hypothetical protein
MPFLHGYATASITNIFHGRQFVLANMSTVNLRLAAKAAFRSISTGIAQMTGLRCHGAAAFTGVCHIGLLILKICLIIHPRAGFKSICL